MAPHPTPHARSHRPAGPVRVRRAFPLLVALAVLGTACSSGSTSSPSTAAPGPSTTGESNGLPAIHHVFVIVLENEGFDTTFGHPSSDPYLASSLPASGALLSDYYGIGHNSNDNYTLSSRVRHPIRPTRPTARCSPTSPRQPPWPPTARSPTRAACSRPR